MWYGVRPTSMGKHWKIILLMMRIYKSGRNSQHPKPQYTPMEPHWNTQVEALLNLSNHFTCNCFLLLSNWDAYNCKMLLYLQRVFCTKLGSIGQNVELELALHALKSGIFVNNCMCNLLPSSIFNITELHEQDFQNLFHAFKT